MVEQGRYGRFARVVLATVAGAALLAVAACGGAPAPEDRTLTLYNAQHEDLGLLWVDEFTRQTGIPVQIRKGGDFELGNQLVAEGAASPADVFITENSPAMSLVSGAGLFAPVDPGTRAQVPAQYSSHRGDWVGIAARTTVVVYNPSLVAADQLPASILDFAQPAWRGRIAFPPGGADFQAIVSAVDALNGDAATQQWLDGLKANGRVYQSNTATMQAVNRGEVPAGIIYHYYWYQDRAESGANSANTQLRFYTDGDAGGFLSVSGGGVLASSRRPAEAQQLLAFLAGAAGQQVLARSENLEYTVGAGVPANPALKPFSELRPPPVDLNALNGPKIVQMMQQAGLL
jgi:iron(III) transport system substrate-binding protein